MSERIPLLAGNWKMNLDHLQATEVVQKLAWELQDGKHDFDAVEVCVVPPFTDLRSVQTVVESDKLEITYGGQDLSPHASGAYTGDISGSFLAKLGCTYVLIGHSERREYHHETDDIINAKVKAAYEHQLTPILCCGEGLDVRKGNGQVAHVVEQIKADLQGITAEQARSIVIAYEPIWAIGTGEVATPEDAQEVCSAIRATLVELYDAELAHGVRVLYGGSVKSSNVSAIMDQKDVDGALVGGASLDPKEFAAICGFQQKVTA